MQNISEILKTVYWLLRGQNQQIVLNYFDFKTVKVTVAGTKIGLGFNEKSLRIFTLDEGYDEDSVDHRKFKPTFLITSKDGKLQVTLRTKPDVMNHEASILESEIEQITEFSEHFNALNEIMKMIRVQSKLG
ncbi:MAG: hypothetical protein KBC98_01030 [Candidatus Pacebacteria bacterium]|nr:hypothetical protein [Candidatus Paceibacterota bacterium]